MPRAKQSFQIVICSLIITTGSLLGAVKLQVRDGRPIVDGIYVNGRGPYRFLIDTGSNINLIETGLAKKIEMKATFDIDLGSAAGKISASGSDGNEVVLDSVSASGQKFLFSGLEAIHKASPDVQGVLGQWFLSRCDYLLDLKGKRLEFGKQELDGARITFKVVNARPVVSTSLGDLALDSGAARLILFGIRPDSGAVFRSELHTVAGSQQAGAVSGTHLLIEGRKIWDGDAVAIANRSEPGVDGLLPLGLFKRVYVSNSEGFVILER
jgi:hypothetical protein